LLEPRLRICVEGQADHRLMPLPSLLSCLSHPSDYPRSTSDSDTTQELIIPLASDTAFFDLLTNALEGLLTHLHIVYSDFMSDLTSLSTSISHRARPMSSSLPKIFQPYSQSSDPGSIYVPSTNSLFRPELKSELYLWREFFKLYLEAEIFESVEEHDRGERSVEESESRLLQFLNTVHGNRLFYGNLKRQDSQTDIDAFIRLNCFILDLKKFHYANMEATRKILKKHSKRTALPLPPSLSFDTRSAVGFLRAAQNSSSQIVKNVPGNSISLPRLLVQAIGEVLLPIIPHVDDYSCVICTSIAFKPIRLTCGHLFCVRCLVKMQKRGSGNCPICRAPTVLTADRTNLDWALLNFLKDWFPIESREKLLSNKREVAKEQAEELGMSDGCVII